MERVLTPYCEFAGMHNAMDSRSTQAHTAKMTRPIPPKLKARATRAGWTLTATSGGYMIQRGHTSRHYGELIDVARDVAKLAVPGKAKATTR